jgi:hypothetical protein
LTFGVDYRRVYAYIVAAFDMRASAATELSH